ncbi:MFS transporter [Gordonia sputi]
MGSLIKDSLHIGNTELTCINTATVIGGLVGRLIGGYIADRWGRRAALSLNLLIYTLGGLISAIAPNYEVLLASRFLVGIGLGGEFTVGLAILSELVATRHRGRLLATLNVASGGVGNILSFGFFLLVLGPLGNALGGDESSWRWTYVILAMPAVLVVFFRRYLPESPRFYLSKGRVDDANRSLTRLACGRVSKLRNPGPTLEFVTTADISWSIPPGRRTRRCSGDETCAAPPQWGQRRGCRSAHRSPCCSSCPSCCSPAATLSASRCCSR